MHHDSESVLAQFGESRLAAILRTGDARVAMQATHAAVEGGFHFVEITLTTPGACECIRWVAAQPGCIAGAGTVLDRAQLHQAVDAGARYMVSPIVDEALLAEARGMGIVTIPGTFTPNEMYRAHRAGADLIKLFPAFAAGPAFVRAVLGPMPFLRIVPTSGVSADNFLEYLEAGAFGVGFVRELFEPALLAAGDFDELRRRCAEVHTRFAAWRAAQPEAPRLTPRG